MFKKTLFQLHWFFGITAGLVLSLMGITGALYSFEDELLHLINPGLRIEARDGEVLPPAELVAKAQALKGKPVANLFVDVTGEEPARLFMAPPPGQRRGELVLLDPYTGAAMGEARGTDFFNFVLQLHRFLAVGEVGKQLTGASTLALIFFCLSGLYLRWPRQALNWRAWLTLDWAKKGRAFNWDLHSVVGTWCLLFYLSAGLTGLYWSYDWYRQGLMRLLSDAPAGQQGGLGERREGGAPGQGQARQGEGRPGEGQVRQGEGQGRPGGAQRQGEGSREGAGQPAVAAIDYDALWKALRKTAGNDLAVYSIRIAQASGQTVTLSYLLKDSPHPRAFNQLVVEPASGQVVREERYADKSLKAQLLTSVYALHTGEFYGLAGRILVMLASLCMPLFFVTGWLLYLDRRRKKRAVRAARGAVAGSAEGGWLIGFASQSGFAEQLAWRAAGQLQAAGLSVAVQPLRQVDEQALREAHNALFVVSTFGDGEAPDSARGFERKLLGRSLDLAGLRYAVLALGDRQYQHFCGFARRLDDWLGRTGAKSLFAPVEVDNGDVAAIAEWQRQLGELSGVGPLALLEQPFAPWALVRQECLNPGSQGRPTYLVGLQPPADAQWDAGDILEVLPRQSPQQVRAWLEGHGLDPDARVELDGLGLPLLDALGSRQLPDSFAHLVGLHPQALLDALVPLGAREYSIASLPEDGVLELIVRQERRADGSLGLGSGWLTAHAAPGDAVLVRLRRNSGFHAPEDDRPVLLIGNGTGLAGLRSLLKARIAAGHWRNWLLFGERSSAHDFYCREELQGWLDSGALARLDLAFSRDQAHKHYVQDSLRVAADELRRWVDEGAVLYVCGSLAGMAEGVDRALREALGDEMVQRLTEEGRYRRDVY